MMNCVFAKKIYTGKSVAQNAYLIFNGQKVTGVSTSKKGTPVGEFKVITPAFIDPHSHIGMNRAGEPYDESEANDHLDSVLALPDALDSIQMDDLAFRDAVEMGVLYSCVVPGSGNIMGGHSAVIRNYASDSTHALIARAGVKAAFGYNPMSTKHWKGKRPTTRMGAAAVLRSKLDEVLLKVEQFQKAKGAKKQEITFSAEERVLRDLLEGKKRMRSHVHKIDDISALLRLVDEFKIKVTVEHAMDVHQIGIFRELKKRRIPIVYGPVDSFAYKVELKHENWRNICHLVESGVEFGLMTDHPVVLARQLLLQTRWFIRAGLNKQQAIELVTRKNAQILGVNRILGTLEKGKWASFVCWNGDPFDLASFPLAVYGEGNPLFFDQRYKFEK
jgi:imidazolonepropionase-like amidohydrolase